MTNSSSEVANPWLTLVTHGGTAALGSAVAWQLPINSVTIWPIAIVLCIVVVAPSALSLAKVIVVAAKEVAITAINAYCQLAAAKAGSATAAPTGGVQTRHRGPP